jgi:L-rhamnose mutarotase
MIEIKSFRMNLKSGMSDEYKKRHSEIWPELVTLLKKSGIEKYYIFLDEEKNSLIAFQYVKTSNNVDNLSKSPIMKKWWLHMSDIMEHNADFSPKVIEIHKVFDLSENG